VRNDSADSAGAEGPWRITTTVTTPAATTTNAAISNGSRQGRPRRSAVRGSDDGLFILETYDPTNL
jgi:hypothetical protein